MSSPLRKSYPDMHYTQASLLPREIKIKAETLIAKVIRLDDSEGMLSIHLAELLGVSDSTIRHHLRNHAIGACKIYTHRMRSELGAEVIPIFARSVLFLPKESIQYLVKVINTAEAYAVYRQLWEYAEKFSALKVENDQLLAQCELLRSERDKFQSERLAVAEEAEKVASLNLELISTLQSTEAKHRQEIAHLEAKLEAAGHQLSLGGNRRAPKFNLPTYVRQPDDIFKKPSYTIELVKKSVGDMNSTEHKRFALQHSSKVAVGVSVSLIRTMNDLGVNNPVIRDKADLLRAAAKDLHSEIMPSDAGLLALNSGYMEEIQ
jgi:hypothetical protein